ncbi:MAG TPA: hypothetical protein VE955_02645 [Candidatus Dormibacteraeota bacterium]|jgi:Gpi18-like mannosyltransferase|nr:hypothetical protein [Candidatus Dormibacteraeota bacterium]
MIPSTGMVLRWKHVLLGLAIRELLAPFTGHPYDFELWARLGVYMQSLGNPYTGLYYYPGISFWPKPLIGSISYPPLAAFIFAVTYRLYVVLGEPSRFLYYLMLKQPMVLSDIGIAFLLAKILLSSNNRDLARTSSIIWLYFPFGIIVSSVWGALDPLALFLTLLAIYYMLESKYLISAFSLGVAILLKTIPVVALPAFLMQLRPDLRSGYRYAVISLAIPTVGTLVPIFLLNWGFKGAIDNFSFQVSLPSPGAMSFLGAFFKMLSLSGPLARIAGMLWIPATLVAYAYVYYRRPPLISSILVSLLVFSVSRQFLPEQWALYPAALLLAMINKSNLRHFLGISISACAFLVVNNNSLVSFLAPILGDLATSYTIPVLYYPIVRNLTLIITAGLFSAEALLTVAKRESFIWSIIAAASANFKTTLPDCMRNV